MGKEIIEVIAPEEYNFERIDKFLTNSLEQGLSRSYIQKLIKNGNIAVNDTCIKQNYKIKTDDRITIQIPEPEKLSIEPDNIPIEIVYEDSSIVVINKQPGLVVHPGAGNWDKTLVNALLFHIKDLSSIGGVARPGIVHRLDKDTSGLMVIAKNDKAHRNLADEFYHKRVTKKYSTIVVGKPKKEHDIINLPIGRHKKYGHKMTVVESGKDAVTEYYLKNIWNTQKGVFSFLEIILHTGRTHQIRVHLSSIGNPIVGDPIYSKKWEKYKVPYLLLASTELEFSHPETQKEMKFKIELPEHINKFLNKLESSKL